MAGTVNPLDLAWRPRAAALAEQLPDRRWRDAVAALPRHLLVPRWWEDRPCRPVWNLRDGPADPERWLEVAYQDQTVITRVGAVHADHATESQPSTCRPTSSSTLPGLVTRMLSELDLQPGQRVLDIATGSGYSAGLLAHRLGGGRVLSLDVDPYLVQAATERLDRIGLHPDIRAVDATGPLPETGFDAAVAMFSTRAVPPSWLAALRPGGRLVTTVAGTSLLLTLTADGRGGASGRVLPDPANFMPARTGPDYPSRLPEGYRQAREGTGDEVRTGTRPIPDWWSEWQLTTLFELAAPDCEMRTEAGTLWLFHRDGSWVRARAADGQLPEVHQAGPRRLWDEFEDAVGRWERAGRFDLWDLRVTVTPAEGTRLHLGPDPAEAAWTQRLD